MESFVQDFDGKVILITGAGKGIGRALVQKVYSYGATVYALDNLEDDLQSLCITCPGIKTINVDLEDWTMTRGEILKIPDPLNYLVNNAGIGIPQDFLETTPDNIDKIFNVNFKAVINVSQIVVEQMIQNEIKGSIVNMSSIGSQRPKPYMAMYTASKAALDSLTRTMSMELGKFGIRVNSVNPFLVMTDMLRDAIYHMNSLQLQGKFQDLDLLSVVTERVPLGTPTVDMDHVVNSTLFLLSNTSSGSTSGIHLNLDGGFSNT